MNLTKRKTLNSRTYLPTVLCLFSPIALVTQVSATESIAETAYQKPISVKSDKTSKIDMSHSEVIVVTGTRTPKLLSNSPVSVDVIGQDEIELLTQGTIAQALNFIPGVVVVRNQKDGYNIQMQGFDGDNVLILLDSQPLISPTGSAVDLDQISAQNIQQIEVIRGAASVMYGSSAMGGVINIITKQSEENQLTVKYELGSYIGNEIEGDEISHQARINATLVTNQWQNQINVMIKQSPGFDYDDNHSSTPAGSLDKTFINLSSSGQLNDLNLALKYQYFDEDKTKASGYIAGQSNYQQYISDVQQHQVDLSLSSDVFNKAKHEIAQKSWQVNTRLMNHEEISGRTGSLRKADIGLYEVNGQYVWSEADLEIVSGGLIHQDTLEQTKIADGALEVPGESKENIEGFLQANWINTNNQFLAGIRAQHDSDFGENYALRFSGMLSLLQTTDKLKWRFGIGQGYRVPTLKERFYEFDHSSLGYKIYGNDNLKPEQSVSINTSLNYQRSFNKTWMGSFDLTSEINLYYTEADDLIDLFTDAEKSVEESLDISVYGNIEKAIIQGVDLSTELTFLEWVGQVNYSYLDAKDDNDVRLESRPTHQVKASIGYNNTAYSLNSMLYFVYQQGEAIPKSGFEQGIENNEWVTVDFKLSQQLTQHFSWRFNVENIFDVHQNTQSVIEQRFDSRPVTSRFVSIGLNYQF